MRRREFITSLVTTIAAWPFAGLGQTASKVYRIGVLSTDKPLPEPIFGAIVRALASRGYMPDRNVVLELRASGDHWDQLPQLAKELVRLKVDIIIAAGGGPVIEEPINATKAIPIVMAGQGADPVAQGRRCPRPGPQGRPGVSR